jgi:(S)-ureidoglycine aminohydrolase
LSGQAAPTSFTGHEDDIAESPFLGDPHARLKVLLPDGATWDMAVNVFTYDPGATLPFVETHVMEHGMLFLAGGGVYRLDADWHPVTAGDALWIAPYCPQWFIAAGPGPARYIYYKDVNRLPG